MPVPPLKSQIGRGRPAFFATSYALFEGKLYTGITLLSGAALSRLRKWADQKAPRNLLSACFLIGQPLVENCSILWFDLDKFDAHSLCRHVIGDPAYGRELGPSMFNMHTYLTSLSKWAGGFDETPTYAEIARNQTLSPGAKFFN